MTEEMRNDTTTAGEPHQSMPLPEIRQNTEENESVLSMFWTTTSEGKVEKDHPAFRAFTGQNEEEMKGFGWTKAVHPDDLDHIKQAWNKAVTSKSFFIAEYRIRRVDGAYRLFEVRGIPIFKKGESSIHEWVGTYIDITRSKELEKQLRQSEQRFRATFEQSSIGIAYVDLNGYCTLINQKFCSILGYSEEEIKTLPFHLLMAPEERAYIQELMQSRKPSCSCYRRYLHKSGATIWAHHTITLINDEQSQPAYFTLILEDVTEQKKNDQRTHDALNALLSMAESLVLLPEASNQPAVDDALPIPTADPAARYLAQLTCKVLDCRGVGLLCMESQTERLVPLGIAGVTTEYKRDWWTTQEQQKNRLTTCFTAEQIADLLANKILIFDNEELQSYNLLAPGLTRAVLIAPMKTRDQLVGLLILDQGETKRRYNQQEIALTRAVARLGAIVIERKRLMNESAMAQAGEIAQREAKQRMETFLGIASHELKTPLTTMNVNLQVAERIIKQLAVQHPPSTNDIQKKIETIQAMVRSAMSQVTLLIRLVSDMVDISRIQADELQLHLRPKRCDLAAIVQEAVQNMQNIAPGCMLHLSIAATPQTAQQPTALPSLIGKDEMMAPVFADPDRIGQVIMNFLTNAAKFSSPDTPIDVHLQIEKTEIRTSVRDYGPGLTTAEQEQVWERFYQGHSANSGLGLGLYISRSLIERQAGKVGVQSDTGCGSTFWFTLPLAQLKRQLTES